METEPLVSILVPVCNTERYLRDCLDSLVSQTLQEIQIICIDDGSTDASSDILSEFARRDHRIEVVTKPNSGYGDSMNQGLHRARGEYIGIVESDDFAEDEMFEALYYLGKSSDADIVKSNFRYHLSGTDPHEDPVVKNMFNCPIEEPFDPLSYQDVFLTQPAIWSAVYRREFLLENGIEFLPTPGASFQDTSFNFKVFSAAKVAVVMEEAFLHYRIDNADSSVKSQKKIFCVCEEYDEIWRFARLDESRYGALKHRIPQIQFGGYQWNLDRLIEDLRPSFYDRFASDFRDMDQADLLDPDCFDDAAWLKLQAMLSDPEGYFRSAYGPKEVRRTYVVRFSGEANPDATKYVEGILANTTDDDEVIFYLADPSKSEERASFDLRRRIGRVFGPDNLFESPFHEILDMSRLRGDEIIFLDIEAPYEDLQGKDVLLSNESIHRSILKDDLLALEMPLIVPLLFTGFYDDMLALRGDGCMKACGCYPSFGKEPVSLDEYEIALSAYEALSHAMECSSLYAEREKGIRMLASVHPFWKSLKQAYHGLAFDHRIKAGKAPSVSRFPAVEFSCTALEQRDVVVSVVIPIYNASAYLRECLDSVLEQDVPLEVICVDDGSEDDSWSILMDYAAHDPRIRILSQLNGGAGAARNRGIDHARGSYLAFIDPDDIYPTPTTLSALVDAAKRSGSSLVGGTLSLVGPSGAPLRRPIAGAAFYTFREEGLQEFDDYENDYGWIRFLYASSLFADGSIRFPETYRYEDPVFLMDVMQAVPRYWSIPETVYLYRVEHKETSWDAPRVRDLLWGIGCNLEKARQLGWNNLYSQLVKRLDFDYCEAICSNMEDEEVYVKLIDIQSALDMQLINSVRERGCAFHLLRAFEVDRAPDLALTRISKRIEQTKAYGVMQDLRRALRKVLATSEG